MEAVMIQKIKLEDVINIFYAREYAYDILRRFFIEEPSKEYLKPFVHQNMIDLFPFQEESEGIREGINDIKEYLATHDPVHDIQNYEDLHWDYTRMFIGPFELPVSPWESAYVTKDRLLFQETTLTIRKLYAKYDFQTVDLIEADDHFGLELDFMYHLNQLSIESSQPDNPNALAEVSYLLREQQSFIENHLSKFIPEITEKIEEHAETKFYIGLAKILRHYLLMDSTVLKELLNIDLEK